ncbi:SOS response-associated peptidase [Breoghania sp. L-A4]|uniref:SOS response-associated peptidase n=1 Tax=Breoghania sp. L-A4 TaxID=2304600 RepID=UPI000E358116|nr:SOS response-associated peptidase [Breoghania sp. L-A4]AXS39564.1 SOS response-associated peptidase [Breoghania sp. L-A4]
MCGRYSLKDSPTDVRARFLYGEQPNFPPRYNIAPTQPIAIVRAQHGARHFALVRWGLIPGWAKDPSTLPLLINARSETALVKPAFRGSMRHHRCLIPANGFYEWRRGPGGAKQAYWIAPKDGGLVGFAGLWCDWMGADGSEIETAAFLTTQANATVAPIHDRMPVVIDPADFDRWLDTADVSAKEAAQMLKPAPDDLFAATPISSRVNKVANDDPDILTPVDPEPDAPPKPVRQARKTANDQFDLF